MKKKFMRVTLTGMPPTVATPADRGVLLARVALRRRQPLGIRQLGVAELERIPGDEVGVALHERVRVDEVLDVGARRHAEVVAAVLAGPEVLLEHGLEQGLATAVTLGPQPVREFGPLGLGPLLDAGAFAVEPGHGVRAPPGDGCGPCDMPARGSRSPENC
jgi:hypothetical protein